MPVQVPLLSKADTKSTLTEKAALEMTFVRKAVCLFVFARRSKSLVRFLSGKELGGAHT